MKREYEDDARKRKTRSAEALAGVSLTGASKLDNQSEIKWRNGFKLQIRCGSRIPCQNISSIGDQLGTWRVADDQFHEAEVPGHTDRSDDRRRSRALSKQECLEDTGRLVLKRSRGNFICGSTSIILDLLFQSLGRNKERSRSKRRQLLASSQSFILPQI